MVTKTKGRRWVDLDEWKSCGEMQGMDVLWRETEKNYVETDHGEHENKRQEEHALRGCSPGPDLKHLQVTHANPK